MRCPAFTVRFFLNKRLDDHLVYWSKRARRLDYRMTNLPDFEEISDNLGFLDDWEDRYKYLIELGQMLPLLDDAYKTDANKVNGCVSQVWLVIAESENEAGKTLTFRGDSDAMIVKGLVAVLIALYAGKSPQDVSETDAIALMDELGLREHLTSQRTNGLVSMVQRIQAEAKARI